MKKILKITLILVGFAFVHSCGTQSSQSTAITKALIDSQQFTFHAQRANPTNMDVINAMNSMGTGGASRMLNLDSGYTLELRKDEMTVTLPYFGRMYNASMDTDRNSYRFDSKDFTVNKSAGRKGSSIFRIVPSDTKNVRQIVMEVYNNGKTYVSVEADDRQAISYDGYITANTALKK